MYCNLTRYNYNICIMYCTFGAVYLVKIRKYKYLVCLSLNFGSYISCWLDTPVDLLAVFMGKTTREKWSHVTASAIYRGGASVIYRGRASGIYRGGASGIYRGGGSVIYRGRASVIYRGRASGIYRGRASVIYRGRARGIY